MRNPLREGPGKGDKPINCHNPKFRKNYDSINWKKENKNMIKEDIEALKLLKRHPKSKRNRTPVKPSSIIFDKWRENNVDKYEANYKKNNNIRRILKIKNGGDIFTNRFLRSSKVNDVIRLHSKGRDISFIISYTGLPSSKIAQIIEEYKKVKK